jgi:large subunit ribosomal protein L32
MRTRPTPAMNSTIRCSGSVISNLHDSSQASLPGSTSSLHTYVAIPLFAPTLLPLGLGSIPSLLADIWETVLRAVPKKKTTHSRSRHRQMAGKALKDVTALNRCSACGNIKRAHLLCPFCVLGEKRKPAQKNTRLFLPLSGSYYKKKLPCGTSSFSFAEVFCFFADPNDVI